ncbi:MAG: DUF192 domain-containing protein [Bdellovibrionales bacterium]
MSNPNLYNSTTNALVADDLLIADSFYTRLMGLMGKASFSNEKAMLFKGHPSIHTCFMRFPIDVVFLDKNMVVTDVIENLKPWRFTSPFRFQSKYCIEFSSNKISNKVSKGDLLDVRT